MKRTISLILALVCVICCGTFGASPAYAADGGSTNTNNYEINITECEDFDVWVNGTWIEGSGNGTTNPTPTTTPTPTNTPIPTTTPSNNQYVFVLKDGKNTGVQALYTNGQYMFVDLYSNLRAIFPDELKNQYLPTVANATAPITDALLSGYNLDYKVGTANATGIDLVKKSSNPASTPNNNQSVSVLKDGKDTGVKATYTNKQYLFTDLYSNLQAIFPDEMKNQFLPAVANVSAPITDTLLSDYNLDYRVGTTNATSIDLVKKNGNQTPVSNALIFVKNNQLIAGISAKMESGQVILTDTYTDARKLFAEELKDFDLPTESNAVSALQNWADNYHYVLKTYENYVFLNNDGREPVMFTLNDKTVEFKDMFPFVSNGRTWLVLRIFAETCGATVDYAKRVITIKRGNTILEFTVGSTEYKVNGNSYTMDSAPFVENGRTYVPVRYPVEALGGTIGYDNSKGIGVVGANLK